MHAFSDVLDSAGATFRQKRLKGMTAKCNSFKVLYGFNTHLEYD